MSEDEARAMRTAKVIDFNLAARQDEREERRPSFSEAVEAFRDAIAKGGLGRPEIQADGRIHRFSLPEESRGKESGWYVYYADNIPSGAFGSWKLGEENFSKWCLRQSYEMSQAECDAVRERQKQARKSRDDEREILAVECAKIAASKWEKAKPEDGSHPYLARKRVGAFGVRSIGNELLVPMWDGSGNLSSLQRIFPDGKRRFLLGTIKDGRFGWIEGDQSTIYLAEGYATAASIHMATGHAVAIAFDAGNMEPAARAVKEVFPQATIIVAADNDRWTSKQDGTPWNVGVEKAQAAAHAIGSRVIVPAFKDLSSRPTDFNDLHVLEGLEAVKGQAKGYSVNIREWSVSKLRGKDVPVREWLVDQIIPLDCAMILAAPGGTGKGMLLLDLAIKIAEGPRDDIDLDPSAGVFGHQVCAHGPVVYLSAEDDLNEMHRRIDVLYGAYPEDLYAVCLPDMDGVQAMAIESREGLKLTTWWNELVEQMLHLRPKAVIIDPLACFVWADLNDRQAGAFVMGTLAHLSKRLNASVIAAHHMNKLKNGIRDLDHAKSEISGSAGFVDHGRGSVVLWPEDEDKAKSLCRQMEVEYSRGKIIRGGLAKNNFLGDNEEKVFIRNESGLLVPMDNGVRSLRAQRRRELLDMLEKAVAHLAEQGHPLQFSGKYGLFEMRERLPSSLREFGEKQLRSLGRELLDAKRIARYRPAKGGGEHWLDVPSGPFAMGIGELLSGEFDEMDHE